MYDDADHDDNDDDDDDDGGCGGGSHVAGHMDLGGNIFLSSYLGGGKNFIQEAGT